MSVKEHKALTWRWLEKLNKGKATFLATMDEHYATDYVYHGPTGEDIRGLKNYKQYFSNFLDAFPDTHFTFDDIVAEGDKVVIRFTWTGTHKGEFQGIPPTNKKITIWGITIVRIVGGKTAEEWEMMDIMGFMQQLGVIPTPG